MVPLRIYARTIQNRTQGRSRRLIRNTTLFLQLCGGTIHASNPDHLLDLKALGQSGTEQGNNLGVQSETPPF